MIDKKGKLFGKISIIDLCIILLLIVFALGIYVKFGVLDQTTTSTTNEEITVVLKISPVRILYYEQLQVGDTLYETENDTEIGTITNVTYEPGEATYVDLNGQTQKVLVEDRYDIYVTVKGTGAVSGGRYLFSRTFEVGVGSTKDYGTKYVGFLGYAEEIYVDEQE